MKRLGSLLITLIIVGSNLFAGTTGKIAGHIVDGQTGEPLAATIVVENTKMGAAADIDGDYFILNVPPGIYKLKVSMMGYTTEVIEDVRVQVDLTSKIDIKLFSTAIQIDRTVSVVAKREIQKDLTSSERSLQYDQIAKLPAKDLTSILTLQSGITKDAGGGIHIRGGRSSEISYMVDGVQVMNPLNRSNGISIDDQSYEEVKAITGTFNAEYGQALSGVVNIVTKKGSDKFTVNVTGYTGKYFSTDNIFSVMSNRRWAEAVANASVLQNSPITRFFDFSSYISDSKLREYLNGGAVNSKPWETKEKYLNKFKPTDYDLQLNLSGPVWGTDKRVTYFIAGRISDGNGSTYGKNYFEPWGLWSPVYDSVNSFKMPDGELVPLYTYRNLSSQGKIFYNDEFLQLSYGLYINKDYNYSAYSKYAPDGGTNNYSDRYIQILSSTLLFSKNTFLEISGSSYYNKYRSFAYEDPYDYRYVPTNSGDWQQFIFNPEQGSEITVATIPNDYAFFGNNAYRSLQYAKYYSLKVDLTSQVNKNNLVKFGASYKQNDITNDNYTLQFSSVTYRPIIPEVTSAYHTYYKVKPKEFAAYVQDKIEFDELIINVGVRYDYFNSDGRVLADPQDPEIYNPLKMSHKYKNYTTETPESELIEYSIEERQQFWYKKVDAKYALSPRFGLSFPITADGVIHFSYGHFFQNPEFQYLFTNPNFWVQGAGATNLIGNADLKPERTTMYEIGIQQRIVSSLFLNVTAFYRDIRDWVSTGIPQTTYSGMIYYSYVNKDHAVAKGVTLSASYSYENLSVNLDYTYQSAMGTNSNPIDAFNAISGGQQPLLQLINLSWDQPQTLNLVVNYSQSGWTGTLTGAFASGYPYTPSLYTSEASGSSGSYTGFITNSARISSSLNFDLRVSKSFEVGGVDVEAILNIRNLFDTRNAVSVYSDTGMPDYTKNADLYSTRLIELTNSGEYYASTGNYSSPRYIQFGLQLGL